MLLLFLSAILVHWGKEKASAKSEYQDYSTDNFWWTGTPMFNATELMTPPYPFLTTPPGHGAAPTREEDTHEEDIRYPPLNETMPPEEMLPFFHNITRPSFTFPNKPLTFPPNAERPPTPFTGFSQYPWLYTPPPNFPPDYKFPTVVPISPLFSTTYIPTYIYTGPTPKHPSFTLPHVEHPTIDVLDLDHTSRSTESGEDETPSWVTSSKRPRPESSSVYWNPVDPFVEMWKKKIASDAAAHGTPTDIVPALRSVLNYD